MECKFMNSEFEEIIKELPILMENLKKSTLFTKYEVNLAFD
jgi:hypothetical protein